MWVKYLYQEYILATKNKAGGVLFFGSVGPLAGGAGGAPPPGAAPGFAPLAGGAGGAAPGAAPPGAALEAARI